VPAACQPSSCPPANAAGTKYGVKQTRGKFGLGAKMALIWSKMTTGLPFEILSARPEQQFRSHYLLDIDIHRNEPNVHKAEQQPNPDGWHGTQMGITIEGHWQYYRCVCEGGCAAGGM
jgi:DNA topoisomerase-6 subunit B